VSDAVAHEREPSPAGLERRWKAHLSWTTLILLGWLLYELTSQAALGAGVACLKFGWSEIRAAFWLRRVDPDRRRGVACFWWYITFALWKVAFMSVLAAFLIGVIGSALDGPQKAVARPKPVSPVLVGIGMAVGFGFGSSLLASYVALWTALRNGVRIWIGPAAHRARTGKYWPPSDGQVNFAPYVTFTALIASIGLACFLFAITLFRFNWGAGRPVLGFLFVSLILFTFGGLIMAFTIVTRRLVAMTPQECWPIEPGEVAREAPEFIR